MGFGIATVGETVQGVGAFIDKGQGIIVEVFRFAVGVAFRLDIGLGKLKSPFFGLCLDEANRFSPDDGRVIDLADGYIADVDDPVVAVETLRHGYFRFQVQYLGQDDVDDIAGRSNLLPLVDDLVLPEPAANFKSCEDMGDLGRAEPLDHFPFAGIGIAHIPKGSELLNDIAGRVDSAFSRNTHNESVQTASRNTDTRSADRTGGRHIPYSAGDHFSSRSCQDRRLLYLLSMLGVCHVDKVCRN
jgi:hypothetical protein